MNVNNIFTTNSFPKFCEYFFSIYLVVHVNCVCLQICRLLIKNILQTFTMLRILHCYLC